MTDQPTPVTVAAGNTNRVCGHWIGPQHRHCHTTHGVRLYIIGDRCPAHTPSAINGKEEPTLTTPTTTALPALDEMTDVDKGCALMHLWKRSWEGASYAVQEYPCRYLDDPRLVALTTAEASRHAVYVLRNHDAALRLLGQDEHQRLYDLALAELDRRCLWAAASGDAVYPQKTEQEARDLLATWAGHDANPPGWWKPKDPAGYRLLHRDEAGGKWIEVGR